MCIRDSGYTGAKWRWTVYSGGSAILDMESSSLSATNGTWYHLAIVRGWGGNANDWALTVDGTAVATSTTSITIPDFADTLNIGEAIEGTSRGWIDEVRISNNARWTANFTPATSAYTLDSNTKLLLHMDGTGTSLVDSSFAQAGPYYAFVFGPAGMTAYNDAETIVTIFNQTGSVWKQALRYNGSIWQYNSDTDNTTTDVTWSTATVNDMNHALSQAVSTNAALRMTEADVEAISAAELIQSGGIQFGTHTQYGVAAVLKSSNNTQPLGVDSVTQNLTLDAVWKEVVQYTGSAWQYNQDTNSTAATNWTNATINDMNHAISEAIDVPSSVLGMSAATLTGINTAGWTAQFTAGTTKKLGIGSTLKSTNVLQNPEIRLMSKTYDSISASIDLRTKQWTGSGGTPATPATAPGTIYLFVVDEQTTGTPTYAVTRDGGTTYTTVTFDASWTFSGSKVARRAAVDVTGQPSGTNPQMKVTNAATDNYKLHAVGLQVRT